MNKSQTYAEQSARKDIEALEDSDKKLKELRDEYHDKEITNFTKNMTKPNRPQTEEIKKDVTISEEMTKQTPPKLEELMDSNWENLSHEDMQEFIKKVYEAGIREGIKQDNIDGLTYQINAENKRLKKEYYDKWGK